MLNNKDKLAIFGQIGPNKATFMSQLDLMVIYLKFYGRPTGKAKPHPKYRFY
jgi:hypothetical protein